MRVFANSEWPNGAFVSSLAASGALAVTEIGIAVGPEPGRPGAAYRHDGAHRRVPDCLCTGAVETGGPGTAVEVLTELE